MTASAVSPQSVFVRRLGEGARKLLALHCTIAHSGAWSGLAKALDGKVSLVAPDMLSHGRSPDWDGQGNFFDHVTNNAAAELTGQMDVVGHSFGAIIALRLALEHPERVRSLTLIEPVFFAIAYRDAPDLFDQHEKDIEPINSAFNEGENALAARLFNRMWSTGISPKWPDLPERTRANMVRGIHAVPAVHSVLYDDQAGLLKAETLERAAMPTLILSGSETHPVIPAICAGLEHRLPQAHHAVVPGAGHMLPISHPHETAALLQAFWQSSPTED
ncbi:MULTISPECIES: alpha/beta fold hydrolase [unclassified Ruegeria]|uniref:alpha/beta fold hydrolase n=1 Tax=unclassified Ruegeria TaxID=2625375 RepID=UPI0014887129|nr:MULTISPECIES: alpha/beta hydrolase [unclassified Ruegeria]NOD62303.1 alpha/beta fold hydrolase [Ruegeria sp. HKCCD6109]